MWRERKVVRFIVTVKGKKNAWNKRKTEKEENNDLHEDPG